MNSKLVEQQLSWLAPIEVKCRRVVLELSQRRNAQDWNLSTLRGVWGAALRFLDETIYQRVFDGVGDPSRRQPLYAFRMDLDPYGSAFSGLNSEWEIPLQWLTFNVPSPYDLVLEMAWRRAGQAGIGSHRNPFEAKIELIPAASGSLNRVEWFFETPETPVRCVFPQSVSLTKNGNNNSAPSFTDIIIALLNRLGALRSVALCEDIETFRFPLRNDETWPEFAQSLLELAKSLPQTPWKGQRQDLERYSGRQKRVVKVQSVAGYIELPDGVGDLWPILTASNWTQIGKSTVQGMGRPFFLEMG